MQSLKRALLGLALVVGLTQQAVAQAPAAPSGLRGDLLTWIDDAAGKLQQLAEAIPEAKYTWRPGQGVRSVAEVIAHVSGANYLLPTFAGVQSPVPIQGEDAPTPATRAAAVEQLRRSFDHLRTAIRNTSDADLDKPANLFGRPSTVRNVYVLSVTHAHEHLGQLIAYARTNGVVPPWSRAAGM
jgi:uncharacterized damage-inducible protein DinB